MFVQIFDYKIWADDRALLAVDAIDQNIFPDSHAFALQQLSHMVIVEELFKSRLTNNPSPHSRTNTDFVPGYDELSKRLKTSGQWYLNYVRGLGNEKELFSFKFADGKTGTMSVEEILFHIVNHGSYHRGSIAHALDLASVPHPADGYGIFIHEKEPERRSSK